MLWVYGHYEYFNSYSAGIDFRRQILTSKIDPRAVRVKVSLSIAHEVELVIKLVQFLQLTGLCVVTLSSYEFQCRTHHLRPRVRSHMLCCSIVLNTTE